MLPYVLIKINTITVKALIDSGAELSLVCLQLIMNNYEMFKNNIIKTMPINLVTANEKKFSKVNQSVLVQIDIAGNKLEETILIVEGLSMDCILGIDLLSKFKIKIDVPLKQITVGQDRINWIEEESMDEDELDISEEAVNINLIRQEDDFETESLVGINPVSREDWNGIKLKCPGENVSTVINLLEDNLELVNNEQRTAKGYEHKLSIINEKNFKCKNYPIPQAYRGQVWAEIGKMMEDGIICQDSTPYINPLVIVKKNSGEIRICLDARSLNSITRPQFECPQGIENLLGRVGGCTVFSKLDLKSSFWLIPLAKESQKYTGFSVDGHTFYFKVVPFGLSTSSSALVKSMQHILGMYEDFCVHYVDDILIFSRGEEEHENHLALVIKALNDAGMKLNIDKCEFFQERVNYLGLCITSDHVEINTDRLSEIKEYPRPKNLRTLRGFLGVINYYKRFVPSYSERTLPLLELLRKDKKWTWGG